MRIHAQKQKPKTRTSSRLDSIRRKRYESGRLTKAKKYDAPKEPKAVGLIYKTCVICGRLFPAQTGSRGRLCTASGCAEQSKVIKKKSMTSEMIEFIGDMQNIAENEKSNELAALEILPVDGNALWKSAHDLTNMLAHHYIIPICGMRNLGDTDAHKCSEDIDIHHIDKNPLNNDISNLVYLCKSGHGIAHRSENSRKDSAMVRDFASASNRAEEDKDFVSAEKEGRKYVFHFVKGSTLEGERQRENGEVKVIRNAVKRRKKRRKTATSTAKETTTRKKTLSKTEMHYRFLEARTAKSTAGTKLQNTIKSSNASVSTSKDATTRKQICYSCACMFDVPAGSREHFCNKPECERFRKKLNIKFHSWYGSSPSNAETYYPNPFVRVMSGKPHVFQKQNESVVGIVGKAKSIARDSANLFLQKRCCMFDNVGHKCDGHLDVYFIDGNIFNATRENLAWCCKNALDELKKTNGDNYAQSADLVNAQPVLRICTDFSDKNVQTKTWGGNDVGFGI